MTHNLISKIRTSLLYSKPSIYDGLDTFPSITIRHFTLHFSCWWLNKSVFPAIFFILWNSNSIISVVQAKNLGTILINFLLFIIYIQPMSTFESFTFKIARIEPLHLPHIATSQSKPPFSLTWNILTDPLDSAFAIVNMLKLTPKNAHKTSAALPFRSEFTQSLHYGHQCWT